MKASPKLQLVGSAVEQTDRETVVDEYGQKWCEVEDFKRTPAYQSFLLAEKCLEVLKSKIDGWYPNLAPELSATVSGKDYEVFVYPRGEESKVSILKAFKVLGKVKFLAACGMTLKALRAAVGEDEAAPLITTDRTGSRKITAAAKMSQAA